MLGKFAAKKPRAAREDDFLFVHGSSKKAVVRCERRFDFGAAGIIVELCGSALPCVKNIFNRSQKFPRS